MWASRPLFLALVVGVVVQVVVGEGIRESRRLIGRGTVKERCSAVLGEIPGA